jgi:hypothetical protein
MDLFVLAVIRNICVINLSNFKRDYRFSRNTGTTQVEKSIKRSTGITQELLKMCP